MVQLSPKPSMHVFLIGQQFDQWGSFSILQFVTGEHNIGYCVYKDICSYDGTSLVERPV